MTQPRRKRRRRRSRGADDGHRASSAAPAETGAPSGEGSPGSPRSRRRRRGRGRPQQSVAPATSSEDIVRAPARKPPATLSRPADGLTLEQIVGELQSEWGVPQSPQEFRITLKVAEERSRGRVTAVVEERSDPEDPEELADPDTPDAASASGATEDSGAGVRREKAPAAPRVGAAEGSGEEGGETRRKRRRSRRRRRGGKAH